MTHVIPLKGGWSLELSATEGVDPASITLRHGEFFVFVPLVTLTTACAVQACIRAQQEGEPLTSGDVD